MKATALMVYDNSTGANFKQWAWGQGTFPTNTPYGYSTFLGAAGFLNNGSTSTFTPSGGEVSNTIGDGQTVWNNITFTITATQSNSTTGTYTFTSLAGGPIRVGMYLASITGTTNGGGTFNVAIPTQIVVVTAVNYTSTTTGTFTVPFLSGTFGLQAETGAGQITQNATSFFNTNTTTLPANNSTIGSTLNAAYQTTFKGYWKNGTSYSVGDVVIEVTNGSTGTSAVLGVFVNISATSSVAPPTTNTPNANWQQYNYEIWATADSALPTYVQSNQLVASVAFPAQPYSAPNTLGNTLIAYGRFTGAPANITATSITSNVLTVTANNGFSAGQLVVLQGTAEAFLNGQTVTVLATGLSGTQFEANFTHANFSNGADTGTALYTNPPTISDSLGNTWIQLFSVYNGADINVAWVVEGCKAGTNAVTFAQPAQNSIQAIIAEYSGVTTVTPIDQTTNATGTSTSASSGNVTTTVANELILGFISNSTTNGLTITPGGTFTKRQTVNGNTVLMDETITTTQTLAATATLSSSVPWFDAIVTLKGTQLPTYYFKWEYGNTSTNVPAFGFQIGTAITATGSLSTSGNRGFREVVPLNTATASGASQVETDWYADSTPGLVGGKFAVLGWRTAGATTAQFYLGWERSKDNFGVDTPLYMTYLMSQSQTAQWRQSSVFATGGINFGVRTTAVPTVVNMGNPLTGGSLQTGNNIPVASVFPNVGFLGNPLTIFLGLANADTAEGVAFVANVYGAAHTYIMSKVNSAASSFTSSSVNQSGIAMRWE